MARQRVVAAGVLASCLLLWPVLYWLVFVVPRMAEILDEMLPGEPLPALTVLVIRASNACRSAAPLVLLLVLAVTVASATRLAATLAREQRMPSGGSS